MKILVCDRLEEKVLDKFEELGEITNISESKTKTEDLKSNIVDTEIVVIRSGTKINKDILENANNLKISDRPPPRQLLPHSPALLPSSLAQQSPSLSILVFFFVQLKI